MATFSTNLSLRKPDGTDFVSRVLDINNNLDSIDALFHPTTGHKHTGAGTNGSRLLLAQDVEVNYEAAEAATLDTLSGASRLINNLNRIRYYLTQISGQSLGTVATSLNTHVTSFHSSGFAIPSFGFGTAAAVGASTTGIRSDATIAVFEAAVPSTNTVGAAAAAGSAGFAARRDHIHAVTAPGVASTQAFSDAASAGASANFARADHLHGMPATPVTYASPTITLGSAAVTGAAASVIRSDATIVAFDGGTPAAVAVAAAIGGAAFAARRDHAHAHGALATIANAHAAADITNAAALNVVNTFTKQYLSSIFDNGNSGAAKTIDWDLANVQKVLMTAACTFTFSNLRAGGRYVLICLQDATGGRTYTWPAAVKWPGGTAPSPSGLNKKDMFGFDYDGTDALGAVSLNY